ncbi:trichohyalin [Lingula anatina]|uniref:Trichohyalin n=1 Tax=Lingula anatina TaxID=7574 RepID=A0A1S3JQP3_LINAN|nr:trichohyalin [Lingula anatina]|eukprot:XP_013412294.1 trichohyalin [Lingula anatina]
MENPSFHFENLSFSTLGELGKVQVPAGLVATFHIMNGKGGSRLAGKPEHSKKSDQRLAENKKGNGLHGEQHGRKPDLEVSERVSSRQPSDFASRSPTVKHTTVVHSDSSIDYSSLERSTEPKRETIPENCSSKQTDKTVSPLVEQRAHVPTTTRSKPTRTVDDSGVYNLDSRRYSDSNASEHSRISNSELSKLEPVQSGSKQKATSSPKCRLQSGKHEREQLANYEHEITHLKQTLRNLNWKYEEQETAKESLERELAKQNKNVKKLKSKVNELIDANKQWYAYNEDRERYVKELQLKLSDQKIAYNKIQLTIAELKQKIKMKNEEIHHLKRQSAANEKSSREHSSLTAELNDYKVQVTFLREQLKQYMEDFNTERQEKEMVFRKLIKLQEEQRQQADTTPCSKRTEKVESPLSSETTNYQTAQSLNLQLTPEADHVWQKISPEHNSKSLPTSKMVVGGSRIVEGATGGYEFQEILRCPKCWKEYLPSQHLDLLEHIDICCT